MAAESGAAAESDDAASDPELRRAAEKMRLYNLAMAKLADRLVAAADAPDPATLEHEIKIVDRSRQKLGHRVTVVSDVIDTPEGEPAPTVSPPQVAALRWRSAACEADCTPFEPSTARLAYDTSAEQPLAAAVVAPEGTAQARRVAVFGWDGEAWREQPPVDGSPPSLAAVTGAAYVEEDDHLLVYGYDGEDDASAWTWDGQTWTPVESGAPSARDGAAMTYQPTTGRVLLFGGTVRSNEKDSDETFEWDPVTGKWSAFVDATTPSPRHDAAMTTDPRTGDVVLFGGAGQEPLDDTWRWTGDAWSEIAADPHPAAGPSSLIGDDERGVVLLGHTTTGEWQQWSLQDESWTAIDGRVPADLKDAPATVAVRGPGGGLIVGGDAEADGEGASKAVTFDAATK
jgi:hypothetical protein